MRQIRPGSAVMHNGHEVLVLGWHSRVARAASDAACAESGLRTHVGSLYGERRRDPEGRGPDRELLTRGLVGHGRSGHVRE